jgi:hypothetical protein
MRPRNSGVIACDKTPIVSFTDITYIVSRCYIAFDVAMRKIGRNMKSNSTSATGRTKGLVWLVAGIALIFTVISLAPVISHAALG